MYAFTKSQNMQSAPNIVPLIDVMLVLLIVFMVSMPMISKSLPWQLSHAVDTELPPPKIINLRLDAGDVYAINGIAVSPSELITNIQAALIQDPDSIIVLDVDPEATYQSTVSLQAMLRNKAINNVKLKGL